MTNPSLTPKLARAVRELMRAQDRSINNLSTATGIPFSTLARRLNGKTPFTTEELAAVADELGTTLASLVAVTDSVDAA